MGKTRCCPKCGTFIAEGVTRYISIMCPNIECKAYLIVTNSNPLILEEEHRIRIGWWFNISDLRKRGWIIGKRKYMRKCKNPYPRKLSKSDIDSVTDLGHKNCFSYIPLFSNQIKDECVWNRSNEHFIYNSIHHVILLCPKSKHFYNHHIGNQNLSNINCRCCKKNVNLK